MDTKTTNKIPKATKEMIVDQNRGDRWIWGIYIILCLISVVESYTSVGREVNGLDVLRPLWMHCAMLLGSIGFTWMLSRMHYKYFKPLTYLLVALAALFYILLFTPLAVKANDAVRAVSLKVISIQPSEFVKIATVALVALIAAENQLKNGGVTISGIAKSAIIIAGASGLLYPQGLTNAALLMGTSLAMLFVGGTSMKRTIVVVVFYMVVAGTLFSIKEYNEEKTAIIASDKGSVELADDGGEEAAAADGAIKDRGATRINRVARWKNNIDSLLYMETNDLNRQEMNAHYAQANGGLFGVGPGRSKECSRLALAFSDYIFSIIVEETGFVGGMLVMMLYIVLLIRAGYIASHCRRALPALLIMGMSMMIALQAFFHMGINSGFFPVSGQPLPMISRGGTSLIVTGIAFGIILSVTRHAAQNTVEKSKELLEKEADLADNPTMVK